MSELREHLDQARREHQKSRYPGDLAADLLGVQPARLGYATTPRRHWLFWANIGALGAVAATVALVMWRTQPTASIGDHEDAKPNHIVAILPTPQPRDDEFSIVPQLAGATLTPQGVEVTPSAETAGTMPAMPSFPSLSDVLNSASTTTDTTDNSQENT